MFWFPNGGRGKNRRVGNFYVEVKGEACHPKNLLVGIFFRVFKPLTPKQALKVFIPKYPYLLSSPFSMVPSAMETTGGGTRRERGEDKAGDSSLLLTHLFSFYRDTARVSREG